jgi:hypothetical protein
MKKPLHVVPNLDIGGVSWARGFCDSVSRAGAIITTPDATKVGQPTLYIGDRIDWTTVADHLSTGYFLAAVDGTAQERDNSALAAVTTTPSLADQARARQLLGATHVYADGFPLHFGELDEVRADAGSYRGRSVGFVGRTDKDKGPAAELALAARLIKCGIHVVHLSGTKNTIARELSELGVEVRERIPREEYLGRLARLGCVANTSPRESLFVSGIEASYLGVPVVAPAVFGTGIADWNLADRLYKPNDADDAVEIIERALSSSTVPDVSWYDAAAYVRRVRDHICEGNN